MLNHYDTPEAFAKDVAKHASKGWVNGTYDVNGQAVGIKAYGKWVQRMNVNCLTDGSEFKTQRDMVAWIVQLIGH
jgi:hypothetical protein